jgi:acyl-CoA reductase-like NAD-dependent aldehyde dehydrogenase
MATTGIHATGLPERLELCRQQQERWAHLPVRRRLRPVREFRHVLAAARDRLGEAVLRDVGRTPAITLACDLLPLAEACRFLEREAARILRSRQIPLRQRPLWLWGQTDVVYRRPHGIVAVIGTWNYPLLLNGVQILQALTAGNGVLWKPSESAPASAAVLAELIAQADFPPGLFQVLEATRAAGKELAESDVDHVVFTGSAATGRRLAENLGRRLVSSTLELSGCDAMIVLPDGDPRLAARAAWFGATLNAGQTCLAVRRAFVPRELCPAFLETLTPLAAAAEPVTLVLPEQARQADRLVHQALADGARLLGRPTPPEPDGAGGRFIPAIVADARPEMALCREASFAPVLAVLPYDHLEDVVRSQALCPYGLGASIFTARPARAAGLAARLRVGMVTVNEVIVPTAHPSTPFGGRRDSGWGVTQGVEGLLEMTVPQTVSVTGGLIRPGYEAPGGVTPAQGALLDGLLRWRHARGVRERWRGLVGLVRAALRGGW